MIKVYHGSSVAVTDPQIQHGRPDADFGLGFYVTDDYEMAEKWACRKKTSIINVYELDIEKLRAHSFKLDDEWLDFVINNRNKRFSNSDFDDYDLLIGATADDRMFSTIEQYENGFISSDTAIKALNSMQIGNQMCIKNQESIDNCLHFTRAIVLSPDKKQKIEAANRKEREQSNKMVEKIIKESHKKPTQPPTQNPMHIRYLAATQTPDAVEIPDKPTKDSSEPITDSTNPYDE